jgi:hypothetical protein
MIRIRQLSFIILQEVVVAGDRVDNLMTIVVDDQIITAGRTTPDTTLVDDEKALLGG